MADLGLRTNLDRTFTHQRRQITYPYIYIPNYQEEIALMVTCVAQGDLPIVLQDSGVLKQVGTCAVSALELSKLLRVYTYEIVLSESERHSVRTISDLMEVLTWMVSSSY